MKRININTQGKHIDPFVAPEGYFDTLNERVMQRIESVAMENAQQLTKQTGIRTIILRWSVAACLVLVAGISIWRYNSNLLADEYDETYCFADNITSEEWDSVLEYTMLDNQTIAYYVTNEY